jgi:hypothetical protein
MARRMSPATLELQHTIIRLLRGMLTAWEKWLSQQSQPQEP